MRFKILLFCVLSFLMMSCGHSKRKSDLIANYEKHSAEIQELTSYFTKIVPKNYIVQIRYESSDEINLEVYEKLHDSLDNELLFRKWDIDIDNYIEEPQTNYEEKYHGKTNSFKLAKNKLNWTNETIEKLYNKLESVNCIGISNWKPMEIEYGNNALGVYSYKIFEKGLSEEQIKKYNDGCNNIYLEDNVVLSYSGGAIGMQCFEDYYKK
ncbi:hypothetical protein [Seonamhaeicola sp. ML3]|uniref:hypothetical protein n=1 Tax=Seonamhaeicola sp. ML3 TaxID=2937786 RepID=UPI00200CBDD9|nr:hypothetical protein [Seonamhaeicola sp. ML3]